MSLRKEEGDGEEGGRTDQDGGHNGVEVVPVLQEGQEMVKEAFSEGLLGRGLTNLAAFSLLPPGGASARKGAMKEIGSFSSTSTV